MAAETDENSGDFKPDQGMRMSDRMDLLSVLAIIWIAFAAFMAVLVGIELARGLPHNSDPEPAPFGEPYYIGTPSILDLALWVLILGIWFGSWGLITLAAIGKGTRIIGGHIVTTPWDTALFLISPIAWHIALGFAAFQSLAAFTLVLAVLPAAILTGVIVLVQRFFTGGLQRMTLGIIHRGRGRIAG
jgi:hypothetical protein